MNSIKDSTELELNKYKNRIMDKCRQIKNEILEDNLFAFKENCEEVMSGIINDIETSIDNGKIRSIEELVNEINSVENKYNDNFPNIPQKKEIWY